MKHNKINTFIITVLILYGCNQSGSQFNTDVAVPVSVEEISVRPIRQIYQTTGVVMASQEIIRKSEISADYQLQINPQTGSLFKMGDRVRKDNVIIRLIDREFENTVNIKA